MKLSVILLGSLFAISSSTELHRKVHYFETLNSVDLKVTTRRKRSTDGRFTDSKQISFSALGRKFNLVLYPGSPVLGPNFRARTVNRDGATQPFRVNPNNFYTGHLADDSSVSVDAHFEDGILSSSIRFPHDTYVVEPAWRHRRPSENYTMITYRGSDVNWEEIFPIDPETGKRTKMKDGIRLDGGSFKASERPFHVNTTKPAGNSRHKRAVTRNTCPLLVVADYQFFRDMGHNKRETTATFLISAIQNVNQHFKKTVWDSANGYVSMGFQIDEMLIHTEYTQKSPGHYNDDMDWGYNEKLYAFSRSRHHNQFCLAHLFTSYAFPDNVLGLAFIAPESAASAGGICSVPSQIQGRPVFPRTGWSSAKNTRNEQVLSLQFELVTTHELGHNWGAEHDPDTGECGPSSRNNGKYVMWPYAVPGFEDNNKFFSPCSKRYIAPVLRSKSHFCFREFIDKVDPNNQTGSSSEGDFEGLCGNGIVEKGEECDVGFTEEGEEDPCCDKKCQLKRGAVCSDFNYACCRDCQVANSTVLCEEKNPLACKDQSFCNGIDLDCPGSGYLDDETDCIDMGKCYGGQCLGYCAVLGRQQGKVLTPCLCVQNVTAMCRRCCAEVRENNTKGECLPTKEVVKAGRTCHIGTCSDMGVCVKVEQKLAHRIFSFIKHLTADRLVDFMRANIVGTIMVLSLLIWVPASWVVSCVDKRKIVQEEDYLQRWASRENTIMGVSREDLSNYRIRNSRFTRIPPSALHTRSHGDGYHQRSAGMNTIMEERGETDAQLSIKDWGEDTCVSRQPERLGRRRLENGEMKAVMVSLDNGEVKTAMVGSQGWRDFDFLDSRNGTGMTGAQQDSADFPDAGRTGTHCQSMGFTEAADSTGDVSETVQAVDSLNQGDPVGTRPHQDSVESVDSIDLSATPGSVSEEEGRTVAEV